MRQLVWLASCTPHGMDPVEQSAAAHPALAALLHSRRSGVRADARDARRFAVDQPATVVLLGAAESLPARITDVSRSGLRLTVSGLLAVGAAVRVEWDQHKLLATVRFRERAGDRYVVGLQLFQSWESFAEEVLARQGRELARSNRELEKQAATLRAQAQLLELTHDTILVCDAWGAVTFWNHGAESMYGWPREEALGRDCHELLRTRFPRSPEEIEEELLRNDRWEGELEQARRDGTALVVESRWAVQRDPAGMPVAVLVINHDITERKRAQDQLVRFAEELKEKNAALAAALAAAQEATDMKSRFLASMSHELRTPMNGILGFAELLHDGKAGPVTADQREYLGDILDCSRHLLRLTNDVLDLSKVEAGKMRFHPERIEPGELIREAAESLRALAAARQIQVTVDVDASLGAVMADPSRLRQVLYNYLSNALKFTAPGGRVTVRVRPDPGGAFCLEVEDTGRGIREQDLPRLFAEFEQVHADDRAGPGTGLGLALTRHIVEAQGGRVGVRSTFGQGSTFFAVLPNRP
jgi:PAS domain S-box-containing protein